MGFFSSIGANLGAQLSDRLFPSAGADSGQRLGARANAYYDEAFPGTNPWERLGAGNPSGQTSVANQQIKQRNKDAKLQASVQTQQQRTQKEVAQIQAQAHIESARISAGVTRGGIDPGGFREDVITNRANALTNRNTQEQNMEKIQAEIPLIVAQLGVSEVEKLKIKQQINNLTVEQALTGARILTEIENAQVRGAEGDMKAKEAKLYYWLVGWGVAKDIATGILSAWGLAKWGGKLPRFGGKTTPSPGNLKNTTRTGPGGIKMDSKGKVTMPHRPSGRW